MGFFSDIRDKIFKRHHEAAATPVAPINPAPAPIPPSSPQATLPIERPNETAASPSSAPVPPAPVTPSTPAAAVDVAQILDKAVADAGQTLHWRTSIVDLMKALDIDSSLSSRKELAKELDYTGDTDDSAAMNIWLHKQVLQKLAANGGTVPPELLD